MNPQINYARAIVEDSLKAKPGEEAVIFTDVSHFAIADELAVYIARSEAEVNIFIIPESIRPFLKLTDVQASALISSDIVISILTTSSVTRDLSQEMPFRNSIRAIPQQHKGRICIMPGFTEEMKDAVPIDYDILRKRGEALKQIISGRNIRVTSKLGTDISFSLKGRTLKIDDGDISMPGTFGNIPAGEIFTAPLEETMEGKIVADGSIGGVGLANEPLILNIVDGQIIKIESMNPTDEIFQKFSKICEYDIPATKTIGEFGIGLNPRARIIGKMLMDEKVEGTVHFAFGDSIGLGKTRSKYHTDLLVRSPTIIADEEVIMKEGKFLHDLK